MKARNIVIILLLLLSLFTSTVFAYDTTFNEKSTDIIEVGIGPNALSDEQMQEIIKNANLKVGIERDDGLTVLDKGQEVVIAIVEDGVFKIDKNAFSKVKQKSVSKAFHFFIKGLEGAETPENSEYIADFVNDLQNVDNDLAQVILVSIYSEFKGDMYQAYVITSPFMGIVETVMGIGAVLIIMFLLFSTVIDLAYLGLPISTSFKSEYRNVAEKGKPEDKHLFISQTSTPALVSYDALSVEYDYYKYSNEGYYNLYFEYLKRRSLSYIVLAICITYLICGGLSGIISFVLNLVSGITGA